MRILVIHSDNLGNYPPVISLCRDLLGLGHHVFLVTRGTTGLPATIANNPNFQTYDLGLRPSGIKRAIFDMKADAASRDYCRKHCSEYDAIWTTTNIAARACGDTLFGTKHIMQLMELCQYTPLFTRQDMPLKSHVVEELARGAFHVVVPEYNRAFIQQAWWQIPKTPVVLPNKSLVKPDNEATVRFSDIDSLFRDEERKIILYQGALTADRDFSGSMDAMNLLGDGYALYLMGVREDQMKHLEDQRAGRDNIVLVPFVPAPNHLAFTHYGRFGLLPYRPTYGQESPLNALYCAPNKIWEYAYFGLPMIGSRMPALKTTFDATGIGVTTDFKNPEAIAAAVKTVDAHWDEMSRKSRLYYNSVDTSAIIDRILNDPSASL